MVGAGWRPDIGRPRFHVWRHLFHGLRSRRGTDGPRSPGSRVSGARSELTGRSAGSLVPHRWVKVQLPADIGRGTRKNAGDIVRAAWTPGAHVLVADLTATASWTTASLGSLRDAQRDLASKGAELRIVVWSSELYTALRASGITSRIPVFANLESALSTPPGRGSTGSSQMEGGGHRRG